MRFQDITDYGKMGKLIQKWSRDETTIPRNMDEFKAQLIVNGISAQITQTQFKAITYDQETLVIKIPLPPILDHLDDASSWQLPEIYDKAFTDESQRKPPTDPANVILNLERLGDYSITNCGEG